MNCRSVRNWMEARTGAPPAALAAHLEKCPGCADAVRLRNWSGEALRLAAVRGEAPSMAAIWAGIHQARESAWSRALERGFRRLWPALVMVTVTILVIATLMPANFSSASSLPAIAGGRSVTAELSPDFSAQMPQNLLGVADH